jgi:para-nitrobenzyl esterase
MYIEKLLFSLLISVIFFHKDINPSTLRRLDNAIVKTNSGLVSGTVNKTGDILIFKGIPFAAPPIGELRWKEPQRVKPWKGIRKCDSFGPNAMQPKPVPSGAYGPEILIPATDAISEDCLYLNVWTPVKHAGKKLPVMVIIHGGGFTTGSGSISLLNGEAMAKKGVVVVTINYRLGVFGFLAHPDLTKESPHQSSGNYGILDQIAAFQWVRENISAFGGDPENITADGGSAGSCSMLTIIASPLGKGLFKRAISESGPLFKPNECRILQQAEQEGLETMTKKGATSLDEMRKLPANLLLIGDHLRLPVVDGYVLSDHILNIFSTGKQNGVDLIIGYNEGDEDFGRPISSAAAFTANAKNTFGGNADKFLQLYPAHTDKEAERSQVLLSRDRVFAWGNYNWAKYQSANGRYKVWYYYFSRAAPGNPNYGAFHGCQGAYVLHNLHRWKKSFPNWDIQLSNIMSDYWVNFAATGNPNGKNLPSWPAFTDQNTRVLEFGDDIKAIDLPAMKSFEFF